MILENYIECMNNSDFEGIARLFTEDCRFNDGGGRTIHVDDLVVTGRQELKAAFKEVWKQYRVRAKIVKLNANSMEYDVCLGDVVLPCIGCATLKDDLIDEYIVRPR